MSEASLATIVASGVILPHDLAPDDHPVFYDEDGLPVYEMLDHYDPDDDDLAKDWRMYRRYTPLALGFYNELNGTDYKLCEEKGPHSSILTYTHGGIYIFHSGFFAYSSTDVSAVAKPFCFEFNSDNDEFVFCHMSGGLDCQQRRCYLPQSGISGSAKETNCPTPQKSAIPHLSLYSGFLAAGVTLSDKAKLRLEVALPALAFYNKNQHTDYKLVDVLQYCISDNVYCDVAHLNFIARQSADDDASNKLFFAELEDRNMAWVAVGCHVVRGKTTAGCLSCSKSKRARQVIHPSHGFRFGSNPCSTLN